MKRGIVKNKIADTGSFVAVAGKGASFENGIQRIENGSLAQACGFQNPNGGWMGTLGGPNGGLPGYPAGGGSPEQVSDTTTLFTNLRWYPVSNFRQLLSELYIEIGLVKALVDIPVDDGLRGGVKLKSKQLSEEQIADLKNEMDREDDLGVMGWGSKWNRLFGGGGILIMVDDQDPESPLDLDAIGPDTEVTFKAVDMWELFWSQQNTDGYDGELDTEDYEFYDYYSHRLHKSRVMKLKGQMVPSFVRPRFRGWGASIVEHLVRALNQYLKGVDLTFEVLDEFKIDVYKVKNLVNTLMNPNGKQKVAERIQLANWQKNFQHAVVMDSEDDWDHKQLSFAGLADTMKEIRKQIAAEFRMPVTKLFGSSDQSAGIGNADQNDMENYNSMVESEVRQKLKFDILRLAQIRCQQMFGMIPDDLEIEFEPLRVLTAEQEENVKEKKFNRAFQAKGAGELTTEEFRDTCNKDNLFAVKLDTSAGALSEIEEQQDDMAEAENPEKDAAEGESKADQDNRGFKLEAAVKKNSKDIDAEIARLREEAEKADDSNNHHRAEALRAKARELERSKKKKNSKLKIWRVSA